MTTNGTSYSAATKRISGSSNPDTSFRMSAPASNAARPTSAFRVSTEIIASKSLIRSMTGTMRVDFLLVRDLLGTGARALAADVDDVHARFDHPFRAVDGVLVCLVLAAVVETVRGHVEDSHHRGSALPRVAVAIDVAVGRLLNA